MTMGQGLMVIAEAEEAAAGAGLDELVDPPRRTGSIGLRVYGVVGGLEFLSAGQAASAEPKPFLGSLLSIKPVIIVKDGEVAEESKQRTRSQAS